MAEAHRKLFLNLPVHDLGASKRFFARLGFRFHARYTDDQAACMIVSDAAFVMLLTEPFFDRFTSKPRCDTRTQSESWFVLSCRSRAEVSALMSEAIAAGGTPAGAWIDAGFMCASSFHDLDGHQWQVRWTDPHPVLA
ncbi:MAG TPA: glyoxalase/bleomycin resistance/extradiol dioxygenase family protein [Polyangiaceae bacterium]|nr:glyoxalase/bleomycin resistance/extradiol dioxygenase family protein [Polyangiaceae bacterium]